MGEVKFTGYDSVFACKLRLLMSENRITQKELAGVTGITRQAISQYMDGSIQPNIEKLYKIAVFFGVSADYFLGLSDVQSFDLDVKSINKELGFSEKAIDSIKWLSERRGDLHDLDVPREQDFVAMDVLNAMFSIDDLSFPALIHDVWLFAYEEAILQELNEWAFPKYLKMLDIIFDDKESQYYKNDEKIDENVVLKSFHLYSYKFLLSVFDWRVDREYAIFKLIRAFQDICEITSKRLFSKISSSDIYKPDFETYKLDYEEFFDNTPPEIYERFKKEK